MTTTTIQYKLSIQNGESIQEEGNFFKANPFQVVIGNVTVNVRLIHDDHKEVVYEVSEGQQVLAHLEHPDYTPECEPSDVLRHLPLSNGQAEAFIAALIRLGVAKGQWKAHAEANKAKYTYLVTQPRFL